MDNLVFVVFDDEYVVCNVAPGPDGYRLVL